MKQYGKKRNEKEPETTHTMNSTFLKNYFRDNDNKKINKFKIYFISVYKMFEKLQTD